MAYQFPQTYPFACPQAKHTCSLSERGLKIAGTHKLKLRINTLDNPNFRSTLYHILIQQPSSSSQKFSKSCLTILSTNLNSYINKVQVLPWEYRSQDAKMLKQVSGPAGKQYFLSSLSTNFFPSQSLLYCKIIDQGWIGFHESSFNGFSHHIMFTSF